MEPEYIELNHLNYKITGNSLRFLVKYDIIRVKFKDKKVFIHREDFKKHVQWEKKFSEEHFTIKQFWTHLGLKNLDNRHLLNAYYKNLVSLFKEGYIYLRTLKYPLFTLDDQEEYRYAKRYVRKREIIDVLDKYATINEFMKMANVGYNQAKFVIGSFNIRKIQFIRKKEFTFYNKEDIRKFLLYRSKTVGEKMRLNISKEGLIILNDVLKLLDLNVYTYKKFLEKGLLRISQKIGRHVFFRKEEVVSLKKEKEKMDKELKLKYYTRQEVLNEFNINVDTIRISIQTIEIPLLVRGLSRYFNGRYLYLKEDIIKEYERRNENLNLYLDRGSIYDNFIYRLNAEGIEFSVFCKKTERLWFKFVRLKSESYSGPNFVSKNARLLEYLSVTRVLVERIFDKELFMYSSKELNLMFFNNNTKEKVKKILYIFLREIDQMEGYALPEKMFTISNINSPYKGRVKKKKEPQIYTAEEFMKFFKYISNIDIHKDKVVSSVKEVLLKSFRNNSRDVFYNRYDSVWLYTLVHLNNAWRHWDCMEIPRINFEGTSIVDSIEWIQNNELSIEDAKTITRKIQIKNLKHSKTGANRFFYCSEQLILPIAYAAVLCEIRARILNPLSDSLVDFQSKNRQLTSYPYKAFFDAFPEKHLKFSSLKMNRTFITLAYNLIKSQKGPAHELEILKFLRNHKSIETTNMYIHISQQDVNFLSNQIFSRDYFGFIADGFANVLFGPTRDIAERTTQINIIYEKLGKDLRLEGIVDALLYLAKQENVVSDIIKGLDEDTLQNIYSRLNMGMLHSKTRHVQCLLSSENCVYSERENCIGCPFAVYNFYALSAITERILKHIVFFARNDRKHRFKGDYERNAILFLRDLKLFKEAEVKFGSSIYEFLGMNKRNFELILSRLPSITQYISQTK
ncbi:hypothetical protein [Bacillus mycoides]|uniref:hypothetical protein n=1 Tax=Bacillus mycoides TaxID=1405 RepID=UPI000278CA62|nr:hypothetical protein [Bacillus mycoides]EJQ61846.1 hypothetical protein IEW_01948 [Bacillus mycoides]EJQ63201.1 hypothetical protein IEY_03384 [Bacillus mycoides]EJV68962.1 hypothetical protein IEU_01951 [Bacillus mycoides]MDR4304783.1 hypothetical protein [Bacillus mycoides]